MSGERKQLEDTIAGLEAQRTLIGDALVDSALVPLRAKLASLAAPADDSFRTLKQVTILFLDIVGSTTLSQRLDPEQTSEVMDGALAQFATVVQRHGGKVLKYAGDSVLAVFGADEAREDDPERAVRAGLALLDAGREQGAQVHRQHGHDGFNVRVGVHTGGVLLGGGVDAEDSIRGQAVNIAARMEQTAPPGTLRISHNTYRHVRGVFDVESQAPLTVKGVDEPLATFLVKRANPRVFREATRGIEGVATGMIGRDAELEALQVAFRRLFAERKLAAVTVVGEAGMGKSRLLYEFGVWSEARPEKFYLFRGRANPQTRGQAFGLLRDILAWRFQISDDDSVEAARAKMEQGIIPLFLSDDGERAESHAHLLGHLIGIEWRDSRHIRGILEDPKQIRNRALHAAAQMFRRFGASDGTPVVLQLDDLHWADNESLDFLAYLGEVNRDVPMLLLALSRPSLFERRPDWHGAGAEHQRIDLTPLDKMYSGDLANELLKKLPEIPAALHDLVTRGAEGNPFYMEELVKMLIDQGTISTGSTGGGKAECWTLHADRLLVTEVPSTLVGVLQARLDGLPPQEKLTLQESSVIGQVFWDQALFALDAHARRTLPDLVQRELALPRADAAKNMGDDELCEYAFHHQILHQVTYDTVLKRSKRELHAKVAQWLASLTGLRANDFLGTIAEHYERAGDSAHAAEFYARASEHARERFGHDAALAHVDKALSLLEQQSDTNSKPNAALRWRLLIVSEQTLELQGRRAEQVANLEALEQVAEVIDDDRCRAYVAWRRGHRAMRMANWPACESTARQLIALATQAADHGLRLHALRLLSVARAMQGDMEGGSAFAEQGLKESRERGLRANEAFLLNALAIVANLKGDVVGALELTRQNLLIYRDLGDRQNEATSLSNLGATWLNLGDLAHAQRDLEEALRMLRANGDRVVEGVTLGHLSNIALWRGDNSQALSLALAQLDSAVTTKARDREAHSLLWLGEVELALERHAAAREAFQQARERALEIGSPWHYDARAGLARVALAEGDAASALREVDMLLTDLDGAAMEGLHEPRLIELTCYRVLAGTSGGSDSRAAEWLARAFNALLVQAATIPDVALRNSFLQNIPTHREVVAAWNAAMEGSPAAR